MKAPQKTSDLTFILPNSFDGVEKRKSGKKFGRI